MFQTLFGLPSGYLLVNVKLILFTIIILLTKLFNNHFHAPTLDVIFLGLEYSKSVMKNVKKCFTQHYQI